MLIEAQLSIASNFDKRHTQWAELNYIYNYFDTRLKKTRGMIAVKIYEKCGRAISSTDMKYFLDSNDEVVDITDKLNKIDLIRNKYVGIKEGFEKMQWRIGDIQKLITAGLEFTLIPINN